MPHSKSRPCSKVNIEYEPPQLRQRDELKKNQLIRLPYTRDCRKKRNPFRKLNLGGVNSPINVEDNNLDVNLLNV